MYGKDREVRLVDFGLSKNSKEKMSTYAGTPYFMAPEVIKGEYGHECDIWSLGCVLYMLVAGKLPFEGYSKPEVFGKIQKGQYAMPKCSEMCQDLIKKMLTVVPGQRPTALQCHQHPWFNAVRESEAQYSVPLSGDVLNNLKKFQGQSSLRRACLTILVKMINPEEFKKLRQQFNKIDTNLSGTIEVDELRNAVKNSQIDLKPEEIETIVK